MESTVNQRINNVLEYLDISVNSLAKTLELPQTTVNNYVSGKRKISFELIEKIAKAFPVLNKVWLLTGEGNMLVNQETYNNEQKQELPLLPVDAMAGALTGDNQGFMEYECERYLVPLFKGAEFLCRVQGNSMWPKYNSGDIVACKKVPMEHLWFQWGKSYVISTRQGVLVKRIEPSKNEGCVQICSENAEKYKPFELPVTEINGVAVVVGVIRVE